jgi:hypothetical protein
MLVNIVNAQLTLQVTDIENFSYLLRFQNGKCTLNHFEIYAQQTLEEALQNKNEKAILNNAIAILQSKLERLENAAIDA